MIPDAPHEQMEDAHFYEVEGEYGVEKWPIDERAIYGYLHSGDRGDEEFDIPHRNALRDLETAIIALQGGDRVRVNDNNWMIVVDLDESKTFLCPERVYTRYENGEVLYELWWHHTPKRIDLNAGPRMFRQNPHRSQGKIHCIEVDWEEREV